jgi:creatinine amidohydrolase
VYPPIYFGAGGGHGAWPSTFMVSAAPMTTIVNELLRGFEANGYRAAILLSGHYPNRNQYLDAAVHAYHEAGGRMRVLAIIENQVPGVAGDHAAKYETSSMLHLHPETVDLARLHTDASGAPTPDDQPHNWMDEAYRGHPCYGLVGFDPRGAASAEIGRANTATLIAFLTEWLAAG